MTKNDKILLVCCFILGCIVTCFISGCSKPKPTVDDYAKIEYSHFDPLVISIPDSEPEMNDKLVVYTVQKDNNPPITVASCKGCHFVCNHCEE